MRSHCCCCCCRPPLRGQAPTPLRRWSRSSRNVRVPGSFLRSHACLSLIESRRGVTGMSRTWLHQRPAAFRHVPTFSFVLCAGRLPSRHRGGLPCADSARSDRFVHVSQLPANRYKITGSQHAAPACHGQISKRVDSSRHWPLRGTGREPRGRGSKRLMIMDPLPPARRQGRRRLLGRRLTMCTKHLGSTVRTVSQVRLSMPCLFEGSQVGQR
jgi:hypothetical protein